MALYIFTDIETDDAGEIQTENGDLKIASTRRSHLQALNWLVLTNKGDVVDGDPVADLGVLQGRLNIAPTHRLGEHQIRRAVIYQELFDPGDLEVKMVPVDSDAAAITIRVNGFYSEKDPDDAEATTHQILAFYFPFDNATPVPVIA